MQPRFRLSALWFLFGALVLVDSLWPFRPLRSIRAEPPVSSLRENAEKQHVARLFPLLKDAVADYKSGRFSEAASKLDQYIAQFPAPDRMMFWGAAQAHWCAGNTERAIELWRRSGCMESTPVLRKAWQLSEDCELSSTEKGCRTDSIIAAAKQQELRRGARPEAPPDAKGSERASLPSTPAEGAKRPIYRSKALWLGIAGGVVLTTGLGLVLGLRPWERGDGLDYRKQMMGDGFVHGSEQGLAAFSLAF